jgi:hypothetical protein
MANHLSLVSKLPSLINIKIGIIRVGVVKREETSLCALIAPETSGCGEAGIPHPQTPLYDHDRDMYGRM